MGDRAKVLELLRSLDIDYQIMDHPAVFTVEQMDDLHITEIGDVCKNLFLRDAGGKRHFIVVLNKDMKADLKSIQSQLGCSRLSFASAERLNRYLGLRQGEVTPLGIINDSDHSVEVVLDNGLIGKEKLGFHPNDNTATVWISFEGLTRYIQHIGNVTRFIDV